MALKDKMRIKYGYDTDKLVDVSNKEEYNGCKHIEHLEYIHNEDDGTSFFEIKIDTTIGDSDDGVIVFLMELAEELGVKIESINIKKINYGTT